MTSNIFGNIKIKPIIDVRESPFGKKRRPIDKSTKNAVWFKYMKNKTEGKCYCCRIRTIHITDFQVGHNKAIAKGGGDNISNLRPICGPCNRGMHTMSIEHYKKKYYSSKSKLPKKKRKIKKHIRKHNPSDSPRSPEFKLPKLFDWR